jgi:Xaa-Pro aminopeptidase
MSWFSRNDLTGTMGTGLATAGIVGPREVWPDESAMARAETQGGSFDLLREEQGARSAELPQPADFDRLPWDWYVNKARALKAEARARGIDGGLFLTQRLNIIYAVGYFHLGTERPYGCFLPMDRDAVVWLYPFLDETLVRDWGQAEAYYFDWHHAEGGYPNKGDVVQGRTVNVFRWWGETLANLGYGDKTIGIDSGSLAEIGILPGQEDAERLDLFGDFDVPRPMRPQTGPFGMMAEAMPSTQFVDIYDILVRHRVVKDDMETALAQRAMDYSSEIHAFGRDYLLERGLGVTDWEVANAATLWGMNRIMPDVPTDETPHQAVGISLNIGCRSGRVTGFPHPNQPYWSKVERGDAVQIAAIIRVGGYGGEQYRCFLIPEWTNYQYEIWDLHTRAFEMQAEQCYAGNTCSNVAKSVHDFQVRNGCAHLIYHRPGHGQGMEGHQPPYHALGDYTVMRRGMHFSIEPGLYDAENGFGFNLSDNVLVTQDRGLRMGTAPIGREWSLLDL